ncbi:uncharacterized protein BYT42DRAFT_618280 [Radiomyces spectabilis]|uniref:uncharacterized protein n=1 Tax=Radiomyces spectabilis TaxID=64574 RepID=UPI00221FAFB4|nr:uncharacterized protein BYT42DRAFT_618280 [Radiomyces spectabilis]KAI8366775.1 hypothetical protein BYT42DRAFT_618280 [Radiomyces spectabilis]
MSQLLLPQRDNDHALHRSRAAGERQKLPGKCCIDGHRASTNPQSFVALDFFERVRQCPVQTSRYGSIRADAVASEERGTGQRASENAGKIQTSAKKILMLRRNVHLVPCDFVNSFIGVRLLITPQGHQSTILTFIDTTSNQELETILVRHVEISTHNGADYIVDVVR